MSSIVTEIASRQLAAAARALMLAGQWDQAGALLRGAAPDGPGERAVLAVTQAEVAVNQDFWCRTGLAPVALDEASAAVAEAPGDRGTGFDLELFRLQNDYATELFGPGEGLRSGPEDGDGTVAAGLAARAARLAGAAPDRGRSAAAWFYAGLIEDNLRGDAPAAQSAYATALAAAEAAGDELAESDALRHLGYHASEAGDADRARRMWERSAEQRQRAGAVPYVLSQQLLLAELTRDGGDEAAARGLAAEVRRWAGALGIGLLESQATALAGIR
jgi:tetratricopeptide (TPR) repeat protein